MSKEIDPLSSPTEIVWEHPVQMIVAADTIKLLDYKYPVVRCPHYRLPRVGSWMSYEFENYSRDLRAVKDEPVVHFNEQTVVLRWYIIAFEDQLSWNSLIKMGLCMCGTLWVCQPTVRQIVLVRDAYGPGRHTYVYEPKEGLLYGIQ